MASSARRGLQPATVVVVLIITALTVVGAFATRHGARSEERNLLRERASEIGLILTDAFSSVQSQLQTAAAETRLNGANPKAFQAAATAVFPPQPGASTALAQANGSAVSFISVSGTLAATPTASQSALVRRALATQPPALTSSASGSGATHALGLAYPVGTKNLVIFRQFLLDPAQAGAAATQGQQPFDELEVALYAAPKASPTALVITTEGGVPNGSSTVTAPATFGADTWLVVIKAKSPLEGNVAANTYWIVLGAGLLMAVLIGALAEALARRRDYALALVDERTAELETSVRQLEQAQGQLLRQERLAAIGELASAVGHELRNPLGVITNAHYLLRAQLESSGSGNEATARHLSTAEREVGAATLIVSDLLDYARAREPVLAPVDVAELMDEVQGVIPAPPNISVARSNGADVPAAMADRDQLRQVLLNLMTNAYEAMPDGGTISVDIGAATDRVRVTVTDPGVGMDEETVTRLFEPFFTRKARGIGLGLAVTKRIVDSHGGTIAVESTPGNGTTFTLDLPAAEAAQ